jgi:hypothetical protein
VVPFDFTTASARHTLLPGGSEDTGRARSRRKELGQMVDAIVPPSTQLGVTRQAGKAQRSVSSEATKWPEAVSVSVAVICLGSLD